MNDYHQELKKDVNVRVVLSRSAASTESFPNFRQLIDFSDVSIVRKTALSEMDNKFCRLLTQRTGLYRHGKTETTQFPELVVGLIAFLILRN